MESPDRDELEKLRASVVSSRAAVVAWRELLIESVGDRLCGSGEGPTPEQIQTLSSLERVLQRPCRCAGVEVEELEALQR